MPESSIDNSTGKVRVAVIGASGYTGADLVRLAINHPNIEIASLAAKTHAGKPMADVFPHLGRIKLPDLVDVDDVNWEAVDVVFCGLPHGTAQDIIAKLPERLKVVDMSADFRIRDTGTYEQWYGRPHLAADLLETAVYGLTEFYRAQLSGARLVACPGCYPTATLMALLPVVSAGLVEAEDLIVDAKSGVSGAGRGLKQGTLFSEAGEGLSPYAIGAHRHAPEIEQEISKAHGGEVTVNFTPHLIPMSRGELVTCYVRLAANKTAADLRAALESRYASEPFIEVLPEGVIPATQHVRGSNYCLINVFEDRIPGRAIIIATLDNLVKGSAGQAIQNFNVMMDLTETQGLEQQCLFP